MDPVMPKYRLIFAALMIGFECWKISAWKITDGMIFLEIQSYIE